MRELFESITYPNLQIVGSNTAHGLRRKPNGEYMSDLLEDHWQTFQEGFKNAVKECADYVRETYDHEAAESIAWTMEVKFGLHGDYA